MGGHASEELRDDEAIVKAAVESAGLALQFASMALRGKREIVIPAIMQDRMAARFPAPEFINDPEAVAAKEIDDNTRMMRRASRAYTSRTASGVSSPISSPSSPVHA